MSGMPRLKIYEVEKEKMDETAQNLRLWSPTVFQICPVFKTINITEWHLTKQIFHQSNIFFGQFFRIMVLFLSILTMMFLPNMLPTNWFTFVDNSKQEPIANPLPVLHLQFLHWLWTNRQTRKHETFPTEFLNFSLLSYNTKY